MRGMTAFLMLWLVFCAHVADEVTVRMRDIGYTLGDEMTARVTLRHQQGESLDLQSLPPAGRLTPWLELRTVEVTAHDTYTIMDFKWQVFATVEQVMMLRIPELELRVRGKRARVVKIPSMPFYMSPVLPDALNDEKPKASPPPAKFDERSPLLRSLAGVVLAVLGGLAWLWLTDRLPGFPRRPGPFTLLARRLGRAVSLDIPVLQEIHASLNQAAGSTLYPNTLHRLYQRAPYLECVRPEIDVFFQASWRCFYAGSTTMPARESTLAWVRQAARAERMHTA